MQSISQAEELSLVLPALMAYTLMEKGRYPGILELKYVSSDMAEAVSDLGYEEFTPSLLKAFKRRGDVKDVSVDDLRYLDGSATTNFLQEINV
ncbi:MAG: hypothetical protein ACXABY_37255 [Candidatus Thorarchaeota archaeon]|jgi:hypothetical protein